jgi:hypothetical protein
VDSRFLVGVLPALKRDDGVSEGGVTEETRGDPRRPEASLPAHPQNSGFSSRPFRDTPSTPLDIHATLIPERALES